VIPLRAAKAGDRQKDARGRFRQIGEGSSRREFRATGVFAFPSVEGGNYPRTQPYYTTNKGMRIAGADGSKVRITKNTKFNKAVEDGSLWPYSRHQGAGTIRGEILIEEYRLRDRKEDRRRDGPQRPRIYRGRHEDASMPRRTSGNSGREG